MITAPDQRVDVGGQLTLEFFDGLEASGKVVWRDLGHVGVLFDAALHPVVVLHLGWQQPAPSFASKAPADRFGRGLPALAPAERKPRGDLGKPRPVGYALFLRPQAPGAEHPGIFVCASGARVAHPGHLATGLMADARSRLRSASRGPDQR